MPAQSIDLCDFLTEIEMVQYLEPIKLRLGVTSFEQLKYVKKDDLLGIGMPMPLTRMLMDKYKKKAGYPKIPFTNKRMKIKTVGHLSGSSSPHQSVAGTPFSPISTRRSILGGPNNPNNLAFSGLNVGKNSQCGMSPMSMEPTLLCDEDLTNFEMIGQGNFAKVYKAVLRGQTRVAVKELKQGSTSGSLESVMKEVRVMLNVRHTNIIHFYGIVLDKLPRPSSSGVSIRLVFEYANLGSLHTYLKNKKPKISIQLLWMFCHQILLGLSFLHERRLLHRDIAARNILVFDPELVKLADFGLSKFLPDIDESYTAESAVMPVAWSAPESLKYKRYSAASDVYMFGVTCWEIFAFSDPPRPRLTANEMLMKLERGETLTQPEHCPDNVYSLILSCCFFNAGERPPTQGLLMQWANVRPKLVTALKPCSQPGKLNFEKGDQIYVLSEQCDSESSPLMRGQNKRSFGVGQFHYAFIENKAALSDTNGSSQKKPSSASANAKPRMPSFSTKCTPASSQVSGDVSKRTSDPAVSAATAVLLHTPPSSLSKDSASAWDSLLYGENPNYEKLGEIPKRASKPAAEHANDLIDLSVNRSPDSEHRMSQSGSNLKHQSTSNMTPGDFKMLYADEDNFSLYDDQSEFYSVVDSDEEARRTPVSNCNQQLLNVESSSKNPFYSADHSDNHPYSSVDKYAHMPTLKSSASSVENAKLHLQFSDDWKPINVQEVADFHFDNLPDVQYTDDQTNVRTLTASNLSRPQASSSEGDLIDLNTLRFLDCESSVCSEPVKSSLARSLQAGGSRFSVDLESVKPLENNSTPGYCEELEDRIKRLREMQLKHNFRSTSKPNLQKMPDAPSKSKVQSEHSNDNVRSTWIGQQQSAFGGSSHAQAVCNGRQEGGPAAQLSSQSGFQSHLGLAAMAVSAPSAPTYELVSHSQLMTIEKHNEAIVERLCGRVEGSTREQCYNALVEAKWNEEKAIEGVKVAILKNMSTLSLSNCKMVLESFKYDLVKASKFVQTYNAGCATD